jgi:hypothetical protein
MSEAEKRGEGWGWPGLAKKAHYFSRDLRSLCGRWGYGGHLEQGNDDSIDNCVECKRRLAKSRGRTPDK